MREVRGDRSEGGVAGARCTGPDDDKAGEEIEDVDAGEGRVRLVDGGVLGLFVVLTADEEEDVVEEVEEEGDNGACDKGRYGAGIEKLCFVVVVVDIDLF